MKTIIVGLLLTLSFNSFAKKATVFNEQLKVFSKILKYNPTISKKRAAAIAKTIVVVSKKHNIPANLYAAILMQESAYVLNAKNCKADRCYDYGISQINIRNIKHYKFSIKKLTSDLHYSVEAGAIILSYFKKNYSRKESEWWTRYNASNILKREEYKRKVSRFL